MLHAFAKSKWSQSLLAACLMGSSLIHAEENANVAATQMGIKTLLPGLGIKSDIRNYYKLGLEKDSLVSKSPAQQARATVTNTFLEGNGSLTLIFAANRSYATTKISQRRPEGILSVTMLSNDTVAFAPYVNLLAPFAGSGTEGALGLSSDVTKSLETTAGKLSMLANVDVSADVSSRTSDRLIENKTGKSAASLGLVAPEENGVVTEKGKNNKFNYNASYTLSSSLVAAKVTGLSILVSVGVNQVFSPKYSLLEDGSVATTRSVKSETVQKFRLSYAISPKVTLLNESMQLMDGVYSSRRNESSKTNGITPDSRFINTTVLSYTLM